MSLAAGDVIFARFPHEDDGGFENRPCLVLGIDSAKMRFLAAKITRTRLTFYGAVHICAGTADMKDGKMRSESYINLRRREWIALADAGFRIGKISDEKWQEVQDILKA